MSRPIRPPGRPSSVGAGSIRSILAVAGFLLACGVLALVQLWAAPGAGAAPAAPPRPQLTGGLDVVAGSPGSIRVTGWALDPRGPSPVGVAIAVDRTWHLVGAGGFRPDLWRRFPRSGPNHGLDVTLPATPGPHFVCAVAAGGGLPRRVLGCRLVSAGPPAVGAVDEAVVEAADQVTLRGWALYPAAPDPVDLRVTVDGAEVGGGRAGMSRPDLGVAFPLAGDAHGFELRVPAAPGRREVCVGALVAGGAGTQRLACRTVDVPLTQPRGGLDDVRIDGDELVVSGWADDPDGVGAIRVRVAAGGGQVGDPPSVVVDADRPRPDVGAFLGVSPERGYEARLGGLGAGAHLVCVAALNERLGTDQLVGCRSVTLADSRPFGSLDDVAPTPGGVRVTGWFADPDTSAPVTMTVRVDGVVHTTLADDPRPDVAAAYPGLGPNRGFAHTVGGLSSGIHEVCVVAQEAAQGPGLSGARELPCSSVVVGTSLAVATTGVATPSATVGPAGWHPLHRIDRDAGVSTRLRDGSTFWVFGDSLERNPDGSLRYFVNNTAAWAPPGQPTVTTDSAPNGAPLRFATPTGAFPSCSVPTDSRAMWPMSAVAVPDGPLDRVLVFMANVCVSPSLRVEPHGVALVEWSYDPATGAAGAAIVGTVLDQVLFTDVDQAEAVVVGPDGLLYAYDCDGPSQGGWPTEYGPCTVARVDPDDAAVTGAYRYWNGSAWVSNRSSAAALTMPDGRDGVTNLPVAAVTVGYDPVNQLYVMVYSPWPGYTNQLAVRLASSPVGPFTPPLLAHLPGCDDAWQGEPRHCYAATLQPQLSAPGRLGVGWYDQLVATSPERGAYVAGTVPLEVVVGG